MRLVDRPRSGPLRVIGWTLETLYRAIFAISILGIVVVVLVVSWQVFSRYVTSSSTAWAPEAAQIAFVWAALLAIAIGVRQGKHMVVDAFSAVKTKTVDVVLNTFTTAVVVVISLVLAYYGLDSLSVSFRRTFPALGIATGWMHLALPVGFICCAIFATETWARRTFGSRSAAPSSVTDQLETLDEYAVPTNSEEGR